ncbi:MAG: hypothetical protein RIT28_3665 [Pseudomonadota bacterium]
MSGLSQEHRTTTAAPEKSATDNSTNTSVAESNSDRLDTLSAGDEGLNTMEDFKKLGASTRGGFTARAMQAAGTPGTPKDVLKSGKYKDTITRVEAAAVVSRVLNFGSNLEGQPGIFNDVPLTHWAATSVYRCIEEGIFAGKSNNTFSPDEALSDGACTTVIQRVASPSDRVKFDRSAVLKRSEDNRELPNGGGGQGDLSDHKRTYTDATYKKHQKAVGQADVDLSYANHKGEMAAFKKHWEANKARYAAVSAKSGVPANLIAALHWRESSGNFGTYLHQGDPLGKPAVNWPNNIPVFHKWEDAAIHALGMKSKLAKDLGMASNTTDMAAMATYAEYYNGMGYANKGKPSPYVYSGTDQYDKGKYVRDGVYDPNTKDKQLGVVAMIKSIGGGSGGGGGTLLEGQATDGDKVISNADVKLTDAKGQSFAAKTNSAGFFSFTGELATGNAKLSVGGATKTVNVASGKASWVSVDAKDKAPATPETSTKPTTGSADKPTTTEKPATVTYTVQSGDTLSGIAKKHYGDANKWEDIYNANKSVIKNPNALSVGMKLTIPNVKTSGSSGGSTTAPKPTTPTVQTVTHTVKSGDTLSGIAQKYYGDESRWEEIYAANRDKLNNPSMISVGMALKVPNVKTSGGTTSGSTGSGQGTTTAPKPTTPTTPPKPTTGGGGDQKYDSVAAERGAAAAKSARIAYTEGKKTHGSGSWETTSSNRGPWVDKFKSANNAGGNNAYEWCGMFVGYNFAKTGIRKEILKNLVFWSGYRLHQFFTAGKYVGGAGKAGSWWQGHKTKQLGSATGSKRKQMLADFNPQPGDIALFRSDYSHVAMVVGYDKETGELEIMEGNRSNKVQATEYLTGDNQITFLGRFNDSDYEPGGKVDSDLAAAKDPAVSHTTIGAGSTTR